MIKKYKITAFDQFKALTILLTGFVLSFGVLFIVLDMIVDSIYTALVGFFIVSLLSYFSMNRFCKYKDEVALFEDYIQSKKYGKVYFNSLTTYKFNDVHTAWDIIVLKTTKKRIAFIDDKHSINFSSFKTHLWNEIEKFKERNDSVDSIIREIDFFKSKYAKPLGYVMIVSIGLLTIWAIIWQDLSAKEWLRALILIFILVPPLVKIFRKDP